MPAEDKKNEFEIWSKLGESFADFIADEAQRYKQLIGKMQPNKSTYTLGSYMLDQTQNMAKLLDAYVKANRDNVAKKPAAAKKKGAKKAGAK